jgi:hypothetical protein
LVVVVDASNSVASISRSYLDTYVASLTEEAWNMISKKLSWIARVPKRFKFPEFASGMTGRFVTQSKCFNFADQ